MLVLLGHASTPDKLRLITSAAGDIDVHVSYVDYDDTAAPPVAQDMNRQLATITTATTTDICTGITGATKRRNVKYITIRNTHATVSNDVTVLHLDTAGTIFELWKATLAPGEQLYFAEGVGFYEAAASVPAPQGTNFATAASGAGFATDTYVGNSAIPVLGIGPLRIGRRFHWRLIISKTAAGTAAPVLTVRVGTSGTTGDTGRNTLTWGAGTAAVDRGEIELDVLVTAIGATAVLKAKANWTTNLTTTGLSNAVKALLVTSSAFDITPANTLIGLSYNGGASAVHTIEYVAADTDDV